MCGTATEHVSPVRTMKGGGATGPSLRHPCSVCAAASTACCRRPGEFNPWKRSKLPLCCCPVLSTQRQTLADSGERSEPRGRLHLASHRIRRSARDESPPPLTASSLLNQRSPDMALRAGCLKAVSVPENGHKQHAAPQQRERSRF